MNPANSEIGYDKNIEPNIPSPVNALIAFETNKSLSADAERVA